MFIVPRLHGTLRARSLVQPTPFTQGSTLAPSYKATHAPLSFWDCLVKTMLTFLLLVFSPLVTSKTFFITRQDLRLVPRALAGALASSVLNFWPLEHLLDLVWLRRFPGPLGGPGVGGGCNPGARGVTSGDGEDGAPHQPLPGGRGCPP